MSKLKWTKKRCDEFMELESLINDCRSLNTGNYIIDRIQRVEAIATKLSALNYDEMVAPFTAFLRELCIADRTAHPDEVEVEKTQA